MHRNSLHSRRLVWFAGALALSALSCGREPTAPGGASGSGGIRYSRGLAWVAQFPAGYPVFQASGAAQVQFNRVRVLLNHPDGTVALDTVVNFPPGVAAITQTFNVALPAGTPASGIPLVLNLQYVNAAGVVVFSGGPVTVTAVPATPGAGPPPPSPVTIPLTYTGPGAQATRVVISPKTLTVNTNGTFAFSAQALDALGNVFPNTPISYSVNNQALATINALTGSGNAGTARGTVTVTANLITGPVDAATLTIRAPAAALALVSGGGQTGPVSAPLPSPVVVQVLATDGLPAAGVSVTFAAGNGGSVGTASATTDASGHAQTTWRLGSTPGAQTLTATSAGLTGSPVTVTATGRAVDPVRLLFAEQPPATTAAGVVLAPAIVVYAVDATGAITPLYTGPVTLVLGTSPAGAALQGTATVTAVAGVATFPTLRLTTPGTYTLAASSGSLAGATSASFAITAAAANRLAFQAYPVAGAAAGATLDPITVVVRDSLNNLVPSFIGSVTLGIGTGPAALADSSGGSGAAANPAGDLANAVITGTTTVTAVAGIATFTGLKLNTAGPYTLVASSPGLTSATGPAFSVAAGPAALLTLASGGGQSAAGGAALARPIVVRITDAFGNGTGGGATITFTPAGGSVTPKSAVASASGTAQTVWTIGGGPQTLNVTSPGLLPNPLVVTATGTSSVGPGPATQLVFTTQPTSAVAGVGIAPSIIVTAKDSLNAVATGFTGTITLALAANPGWSTPSGTVTAAAVAGVATFAGISLNKVGTGYTLQATSKPLTPATSAAFNISAAAANTIAVNSGNGQAGTVNSALALPFVAKVTDAFGNAVAGVTVTWATPSGGSFTTPTSVTTASGIATNTWTLGAAVGPQAATATTGALSGSPVSFTATAIAGGATQFILAGPSVVVDTAISDAFTIRLRNVSGNQISGSKTFKLASNASDTYAFYASPNGATPDSSVSVSNDSTVQFWYRQRGVASSQPTITVSATSWTSQTATPTVYSAAQPSAKFVCNGNGTANNATSVTDLKSCAATVVGNLMIAAINIDAGSTNGGTPVDITPPSGWTLIQSNNTTNLQLALYYKHAGASDVGTNSYVFSWTGGQKKHATSLTVYSGVATSNPIDAVSSNKTLPPYTQSSVATSDNITTNTPNTTLGYIYAWSTGNNEPQMLSSFRFPKDLLPQTVTSANNQSQTVVVAVDRVARGTTTLRSVTALKPVP